MFSKRHDGRILKTLDPMSKLSPFIMRERNDASNLYKQDIETDVLDQFIKDKRAEGYEFDYMTILIAAMVKMIAQRPSLNRFVINSRIYARNDIQVSFVVKKSLRDDAEETTIKLHFEGTENIYEVSEKIKEAIKFNKKDTNSNATDHFAEAFLNLPNFLVKFLIGFVMRLDKWNMLPESIIELSPFHTSLFITNIKSIRLNYMYHHLYNFGSTSIFVALGKTNKMPVVKGDEIVAKDVFTLGFVMDERTCDGLYMSNSLRLLMKYVNDPTLLEQKLEKRTLDID